MLKKMRCGGWHARTGVPGISILPPVITTGMMANCTMSASPAFTAAITTAVPLVRAGRGHRSDRSGIAADQPVAPRAPSKRDTDLEVEGPRNGGLRFCAGSSMTRHIGDHPWLA